MIEQQAVVLRSHDDEADALARDDDVARRRGVEARQEPIAGALRIEAAEPLEARAHRGDADRDQRLGVVRDGRPERDGGGVQACFQPSVSPARSGFSEASPNGTLAGSSYASRRSVTVPALRGRP